MAKPRADRPSPTGTITFLFTDIEGSTRAWQAQRAAMQRAVARHDELIRQCVVARDGHVFKTVGDAFCTAFPTAPQALAAALAAQQALNAEPWPDGLDIRVRMALHTGEAERRNGDYFGPPLNHVARLLACAHGGQTLVSGIAQSLCRDRLPIGSALRPLGTIALQDINRPDDVFQLCHAGLPSTFPPLRTTVPAADTSTAPSIAVMPFVNIGRDEENEYFADGLSEELMNVLSNIRGLRVSSRTSAFYFKNRDVDLQSIASKLNVATILEGSVRKSGNRVRITAQLVQMSTDSHLWSKTYDRQLDDIFAVQDDIAQSVVSELRTALLPASAGVSQRAAIEAELADARKGRSENAEAYRLFMQGRFLVERRTESDVAKGAAYLRQATEIDPQYALAWAALAHALIIQAGSGGWIPYHDGYECARDAAERALALEPALAEGQVALALVRMGHDRDWPAAEALMKRAVASAPANAGVLIAAAMIASNGGSEDDAIALSRCAIAADPLNAQAHRYFGLFSYRAGLLAQAEAALKESIELSPQSGLAHHCMGMIHVAQGRAAEAAEEVRKESVEAFRLLGEAVATHALGQETQSAAAVDALGKLAPHQYLHALGRAYRGEVDEAFASLERAYTQGNAGLGAMKSEPLLKKLHADPRWPTFLKKMRLVD
jgi:TolB-like protein/class 3 adenylate cyclase/Tfp pilus assembly protein PilF